MDGSRRQALAALCATEITSYGVIYYAFPVLATQITAAVLNGVFNAPLVAAGAIAPGAGAAIAAAAGSYPVLFVLLAGTSGGGAALAATAPPPASQPEQALDAARRFEE